LALVVGLGLRGYHYLRDPSMWHDEAALVQNVLGKSFAELLGPLYFSEAAPPLFLLIEKGVAGVLGDSTFALRLVPFLASCASLIGMAVIARRLLAPMAAVWVVVLFACSDRLLWHACEAKPYAVDVLVATLLLGVLLFTHSWSPARQLLLFMVLSPFLIFLSYPACFLLGGLALSLLPAVVRARQLGRWLLFGAFLLTVGISFWLLLTGPIRAQRDVTILQCWSDMFPRWDQPWTVPGWLALRLPEIFRYAYEPVGNVLAVVAMVGGVALWRSGQQPLLAFLMLPVALTCLAALAGQYPIGATRVMVFATPAAVLLMGAGLPIALAYFRRFGKVGVVALAGMALFPVGQSVYRAIWTWERADSAGAAAFVRGRRLPDELIVGTAWEQDYYFRDARQMYCFFDPKEPRSLLPKGTEDLAQARRLWLLASSKTDQERRRLLAEVQASGNWSVRSRADFEGTSVFLLEKGLR
jgi:hypothetical protein